jgi:hypothetical protein
MTRLSSKLLAAISVLITLANSSALAAGGGGEAIVFVADSRRFTGWRAWCTNLYNENLFYFALLTVITIPVLALFLGTVTGFFMARLGINLKSRVVAEH